MLSEWRVPVTTLQQTTPMTRCYYNIYIYMKLTAYDGTTTSDTQPKKIMTIMGEVDTSDLMMIMMWVINISSQSPRLGWASLTHTTPHVVKKQRKVTKRTNYILDTLSPEYTQQAFTQASRIFHHMCYVGWLLRHDALLSRIHWSTGSRRDKYKLHTNNSKQIQEHGTEWRSQLKSSWHITGGHHHPRQGTYHKWTPCVIQASWEPATLIVGLS